VQRLRHAATDAGNLASNDHMAVDTTGGQIALAPTYSDEMYLPYYDPNQIYGPWWWPAEPPVAWAPWPGYSLWSGYGFCWAPPIVVSVNFFFASFNWKQHHVIVVDRRPFYFHGRDHKPIVVHNGTWQHDPAHRRSVQYHNPILRTQYASAAPAPAPRVDRTRTRTNDTRPGGNPMARPAGEAPRTASVPSNPVARTDRQQGFFPPQHPAPQNEAQTNAVARPPAYVQHHVRPPVDAPQQVPQVVHYAYPGIREAPAAVAPSNGQPIARAVPQGTAPVAHEGGEAHGNGIQRGSGGPDMRGGGGRDR